MYTNLLVVCTGPSALPRDFLFFFFAFSMCNCDVSQSNFVSNDVSCDPLPSINFHCSSYEKITSELGAKF